MANIWRSDYSDTGRTSCESCARADMYVNPEGASNWSKEPARTASSQHENEHCDACTSCLNHEEADGCVDGDQSDNQAADRAVSQTIQAPPDRSGDTSRRPQLDHSYEDRQEMQRENVNEIMGGRD